MTKKLNGYIKWFFVIFAVAGILWNAATLHNDVLHMKTDIAEIKQQLTKINEYLLERAK